MADVRQRRRGDARIRASTLPPRHLLLHIPPTDTRPPPRDHRSASLPLHASFALCRLVRWAPPAPAAAAVRGLAEGVAARVGWTSPVSPKRGRHERHPFQYCYPAQLLTCKCNATQANGRGRGLRRRTRGLGPRRSSRHWDRASQQMNA
jgi:hypothetical protein